MPNRILMVLNKPDREAPLMQRIAEAVLRLDPCAKIEIKSRLAPDFVNAAVRFRPSVILTFPLTGEGLSVPYLIIKNITNCRVICLRTEGLMNFSDPFNRDLYVGFDAYQYPLVDLELFWGPGMAEMVGMGLINMKKLESAEQIRVVGYNRLEPYFGGTPDIREEEHPLLRHLATLDRQKVIIAVTGFHFADYTEADLFNARDLDAANNLPLLLAGVDACARFRADYAEMIARAARAAPDATFILKMHPLEKNVRPYQEVCAGLQNVILVADPIPAEYIIPKAGLLVHYGSTCLVDAVLSEIPSVHVKFKEMPPFYEDLSRESSFTMTSDEVPDLIARHLSSPIKFELTPRVQQELLRDFAITIGEPYRPSQAIAEILVEDTPAIPLPPDDPHLNRAMDLFFAGCL